MERNNKNGEIMSNPRIKDVAKEANVSTATVSRVINDTDFVSDTMKQRVHMAIEKLNYRPNMLAKSLKQDKTYTVGIVIPDISNEYFMSISRGIEDELHDFGYNLIFCSSDEKSEKEKMLLQLLHDKRVDGIVLASSGGNDEFILQLNTAIPIVLIDRKLNMEQRSIDYMVEDNFKGAYLLTKKLLDLGHRQIAVINGLLEVSTGFDRYNGYLQAMKEAGLDVHENLMYDGKFTTEGGKMAVSHLFQLPFIKPTALISFNNKMTFGALLVLTKQGFRLPDDIMLASYGNLESVLLLHNPQMYYIDQCAYSMGTKSGQILRQKMQTQSGSLEVIQEVLEPELKMT
jgi:LacI family transcriptional regulator